MSMTVSDSALEQGNQGIRSARSGNTAPIRANLNEGEDDVAQTEAFGAAVDLAAAHVGTFGYVQFQVRGVDEARVVSQAGGISIVQPRVTPLRTGPC